MKPQQILDKDVQEIDWRTVVPQLGIEPMNGIEAADWQGDVAALKMGSQVFIDRMNRWDNPHGKGVQPTYMLEQEQQNNFEGITPDGDVSFRWRSWSSPTMNSRPLKIPSSFKDDEERMNFVKYCRMVHLYMDRADTKNIFEAKKAKRKAHIVMALVVALLYQKGLKIASYTIGSDTMLSEALGFAGFSLEGKPLSGKEQAQFINETVHELSTNGKVKPKGRSDLPFRDWAESNEDKALRHKIEDMSEQEKNKLLMKFLSQNGGRL